MNLLGNILQGGFRPNGRAGGAGSLVVGGVLVALALKAAKDRGLLDKLGGAAATPGSTPAAGPATSGGLGDILGGAGGLGGLLGSLGGAGALGSILTQLTNKGLGEKANSWVGSGANQPVSPDEVASALDEEDLKELETQTGLPRAELLASVADALPAAVDTATPAGQLPKDDEELIRWAS